MRLFDYVIKDLKIDDKDKEEISKLIDNKEDINEIGMWIDIYFDQIKNNIKENIK